MFNEVRTRLGASGEKWLQKLLLESKLDEMNDVLTQPDSGKIH